MTTPLDLSGMPRDWQLCFNAGCPFSDRCLRFLAGNQLAATREWGAAIYPSALHDGRCDHFCPAVPVRSAVGFTRLFDAVKACHAAPMRRELKSYLGGNGTYYLYRNGQLKDNNVGFNPEIRKHIEDVFITIAKEYDAE